MKLEVISQIREIDPVAWDALAAPCGNPFVRFAFLDALEQSGCVAPEAGWTPLHHLVRSDDGALLAAAPAYVKDHSYGEYVFDHAWAAAYERAGGRYYPKLLVAVPFTPVTGPRLLGGDPEARAFLAQGLKAAARQFRLSSVHVNFPDAEEAQELERQGYLLREDTQYIFHNNGYADFDAFLAALSANRRKSAKRERRDALAGLEVEILTGGDLTEAAWDAFFTFYMDTGERKWGVPYLNRRFFSLIGEQMGEQIVLFLAKRDGAPIAGALNFRGADALYGRYWGSTETVPFLHFELCYHQAVEYAIRHGLKRVEAGAQGDHKLARGYLPAATYSAHVLLDPSLQDAVARYLRSERRQVQKHRLALLDEGSPFKNTGAG